METSDFFRSRIDAMINLSDPLAVLATRLPWNEIEAALAPMFAHKDRAGQSSTDVDLFGPTLWVAGAGSSNAGRPRLQAWCRVSGERYVARAAATPGARACPSG